MLIPRLRWFTRVVRKINVAMDPFRRYILIVFAVLLFRFPPNIPFNIQNKLLTDMITYFSTLHDIYINEEMPAVSMSCKPKHPVIILPGIVSSTLEAWQGMKEFRTSVWGKADMLMHILSNSDNWEAVVSLDPKTGLDQPGIKVRPANGLSSSDYILPLYWVWQKIVENLGILGYDHKNLHVASYDWRLDVSNLEVRDSFFTKLKLEIEMYYALNKEKVVILGHSFGNVVTLYFFSWVEEMEPGFVDKHIHSLISIASPFLGSPKSIAGLLSGESKNSASLLGGSLLDFMIDGYARKRMFNTWGSIRSLLPKGGNKFWNEPVIYVENVGFDAETIVEILKKRNSTSKLEKFILSRIENMEIDHTKDITTNDKVHFCISIVSFLRGLFKGIKLRFINTLIFITNYFKQDSYVFQTEKPFFEDVKAVTDCQIEANCKTKENLRMVLDKKLLEEMFKNSQHRMGLAFDFLYSFKTKLGNYTLKHKNFIQEIKDNVINLIKTSTKPIPEDDIFRFIDPTKFKLPNAPNLKIYSLYGTGKETERGYHYLITKNKEFKLNTKINNRNTRNGVILCDGDGTVPVFSCGYMPFRGWKRKELNPAGVRTFVREYKNEVNMIKGIRGGPKTSDHVDILGNHSLMKDIIKICCGEEEEIKDKIISNLVEMCDEIDSR